MENTKTVSDYYGCHTFNDAVMKQRLTKNVYLKLKQTIENGEELEPSIADYVANAMKEWAIENGATHFTHWFQPLTGITAEKHDAFVSAPDSKGQIMMEFSGKELIKGEPDASSFPSGGLRATFEARGYTTWDCTSPAFLKEDACGMTLCIPTAFCSYKGEALDQKTPLLRSIQAIDAQAMRILRLFGDTTATHVTPSVGIEQEYFLIDRNNYLKRNDLVYTGRTLFGAPAPKGQEMDDHYFGAIRERVGAYMKDVNEVLWKLGVPSKTQHNEVAPAQHELAPVFESCNLAVDHNQMIMETLKKVAIRHGLTCLLHEKPFDGVNGSGKHDNWSLTSDTGFNMLSPGKTPHQNIQFLLVIGCILKAVDEHADLLRWSTACVGNDCRLGAHEAPPAIISVFLGEQLENVINQICAAGEATYSKRGGKLNTGVDVLPKFDKDAADRNRTSPFAFTGNKFEFRMAGSSDSVSSPNVVLNTIVAESFKEAADILESAENLEMAIHDMIRDLFLDHSRVIFSGNGYGDAWVVEAERRGLPNIRSMVDAIPAIKSEKAVKLFESFGVFTKAELESRAEVEYETYYKTMHIEAKTMIEMASKQIVPVVVRQATELAKSIESITRVCPAADVSTQTEILMETSNLLAEMNRAIKNLSATTDECYKIECGEEKARAYYNRVVPAMKALRAPADALEQICESAQWPFPSYGELMFEV